ncbi:peptide deformylase [Acetobacter pasteurianus]|nr:peptide deformylase [Acetobacter pasteurianus]
MKPEDVAEIRKILPNMFSAMYQAPGIGLAAPQVGLSQRFILVDLGEKDARDPIVMINPEVIAETEDMAVREEGCLSLPNQYAEVVRPEKIRVRWNNVNGDVVEREAEGLLATCIQHEIDHLEGVLFVDHLSALRRNMILRRLAKELKRK